MLSESLNTIKPEPDTSGIGLRFPQVHPQVAKIFKLDQCLAEDLTIKDKRTALAAILESAESRSELSAIVHGVGSTRLTAVGGQRLCNLVALAKAGQELCQLCIPEYLSRHAPRRAVDKRVSALCECLKTAQEVVSRDPSLALTPNMRRFQTAFANILEIVKSAVTHSESTKELRNYINTAIAMTELAIKYGFIFTSERHDSSRVTIWSRAELEDIKLTFEELPERLLLFTPKLGLFHRVRDLGEDTYALRLDSGEILISNLAVNNRSFSKIFERNSSLQFILCHEIGHAIQIGAARDRIMIDEHSGEILGPADPRYPFAEYLELSDWKVLGRSKFKLCNAGQAILFDGSTLALGTPVRHRGEMRTFIYDPQEKVVFSYRPDSGFSLNIYSRESPWEDWAESFAEYIFLPGRLVTFAPEKFLYFERHIGRHRDNQALYALLKDKQEELQWNHAV